AHGKERPGTDVQGDGRERDAAQAQRLDESVREVEAGGRRGHGSPLASEDGLVALAIARLGRAVDVRRQRRLSRLVEIPPQVLPFDGEPDGQLALAGGDDLDPRAMRLD